MVPLPIPTLSAIISTVTRSSPCSRKSCKATSRISRSRWRNSCTLRVAFSRSDMPSSIPSRTNPVAIARRPVGRVAPGASLAEIRPAGHLWHGNSNALVAGRQTHAGATLCHHDVFITERPMTDWQHEFPQDEDLCYLNHAAVAPWPKRSHDAVVRFAAESLSHGARHYPRWLATEARLREQLQRLIYAPSSDDTMPLTNTSEGLSVIAAGLEWQPGDRVLISNQEFPSNRIPWQALERHGVSVDQADLSGDDPEGALIAAMTPETRLLSISSVQYGTGLRMDLARLGEACRERGILFCVDAIQSLGVLPMDVQAINADFVVADGHKWMLGPEGLALFYCRAALRPTLTLHQHGWHMVADAGDYSRQDWQPAHDGTRF